MFLDHCATSMADRARVEGLHMVAAKNEIRVSVLTPSWNRADLLSRVWDGLKMQSGVSFEWVVGNDGSTDGTSEVVAKLAQDSLFPVTLVEASLRIGKACMDNSLVQAASGEFVIWCDSDDTLLPDALSRLIAEWDRIPNEDQHAYMGVSARAETEECVLGARLNHRIVDWEWNRLFSALRSDLVIFARTDLMRKHPFKEVDFLIPESSVWNIIGTLRTKFADTPLKRVYYRQPNALSFSGKMQYSRGRAYALGGDYQYVKGGLGMRGELMRAVNFIRYCAHGDIGFGTASRIWSGSFVSNCMLLLGAFPAFLLVMRDRWRGVVEKTHIEFERNRKVVRFSRKEWNGSL